MKRRETSKDVPNGTASSNNAKQFTKAIDPSGVYERAGYWLLTMSEILGWHSKMVYTGHTLKRKDDTWLLVVRGTKKGKKRVLFVEAPTPLDCIVILSRDVARGNANWRDDLY